MQVNLRIAEWNANGLPSHKNEIETFLYTSHIDILLISETHFTSRTYFRINGYDLIAANHPDNRAHAGAAVLVKSSIRYETLPEICEPHLQAAGIKIKCNNINIAIYSIYCPPRHSITCTEYEDFFKNLGSRFLVVGDFNAKHPLWGSRLVNPKGRELHKCILKNKY